MDMDEARWCNELSVLSGSAGGARSAQCVWGEETRAGVGKSARAPTSPRREVTGGIMRTHAAAGAVHLMMADMCC